jgi:NAD(P)-dependent dehydrogenase (short-subunit alcohol dehydrogenase family)
MDNSLAGGVAIVAGGSGGIGSTICLALAAAGSNVAFTYRSRQVAAEEVMRQIEAQGRQALAIQVDQKASEFAVPIAQ